ERECHQSGASRVRLKSGLRMMSAEEAHDEVTGRLSRRLHWSRFRVQRSAARRSGCAGYLQAVMRPLGREVARLERRCAERVRVTAHEHRDHRFSLDAKAFLKGAADSAHDALLVASNRPLW